MDLRLCCPPADSRLTVSYLLSAYSDLYFGGNVDLFDHCIHNWAFVNWKIVVLYCSKLFIMLLSTLTLDSPSSNTQHLNLSAFHRCLCKICKKYHFLISDTCLHFLVLSWDWVIDASRAYLFLNLPFHFLFLHQCV